MDNKLSGQNVLVTGGTGLVGSHVAERLVKLGANVFVLDIVLRPKSYFDSQQLQGSCAVIMQDVLELNKLKEVIAQNRISHIFHLAAQALVTTALLEPRHTLDVNIMGTVNVLEAARENKSVKAVLVASSDKAYGKDCANAKEDQKVFGDHPYDASKAAADIIARTYFKTYGTPVSVARFGNIFGPGDLYPSRLVPGIMESIIKNKQLEIRSDGEFRRDYLYVKDVAGGYVKMAENIDSIKGEAFNFSTNWNFSVIELVEKIGEAAGVKCDYKILNTQKNEIPEQSLNSEKAKKFLGWQPETALKEAILQTYNWYKQYYSTI